MGLMTRAQNLTPKEICATGGRKKTSRNLKSAPRRIADQYAQYVVVDDLHINSRLTLGEDVADLGGEILAYIAWKDATKDKDLNLSTD